MNQKCLQSCSNKPSIHGKLFGLEKFLSELIVDYFLGMIKVCMSNFSMKS